MTAPDASSVLPVPPMPDVPSGVGRGVVAKGWLAGQSVFDPPPERKVLRSFAASAGLHGVFFLLAVVAIGLSPARDLMAEVSRPTKYVYLNEPGPGGGGGGSPAPAPKKELEIPKHKPAETVPVPTPAPPPPTPTLTAPIETNLANVFQATGASSVSIAAYAGGGSGGGLGSGRGSGVGPGTGGGFGGGAYRPGAGITNPTLIKRVDPVYTSEAMRAKIQGTVELDAVVLENGTIGEVLIVKSLDKNFGLDQEAVRSARGWLFVPGKDKEGRPIPVIIRLILDFRIH
jgi:protein TonB